MELRCSRCKENKSVEAFGRNRSRKTGYDNVCRTCRAFYWAQYKERKEWNK